MKIYVIFHGEQDINWDIWEVCDFEAFFDKDKAEERAKELTENSSESWVYRVHRYVSEMEIN